MSKFENVGQAMAKRDSLITRLNENRTMLKKTRNSKESPSKAGSIASAEAAHEKDCDVFAEAHAFVVASRTKSKG
jgi:hypothetical protein